MSSTMLSNEMHKNSPNNPPPKAKKFEKVYISDRFKISSLAKMDFINKLFRSNKANPMDQKPTNFDSNAEPAPKLFKLNVDCFDEIFEYLSLKDLQTFGQTCKTMQKVAGEYFKRNYRSAEKFSETDGIHTCYNERSDKICRRTPTSIFNQFVNYSSHYSSQCAPLRYIEQHSHEFTTLNQAYFVCFELKRATDHFRKLWSKIEHLQIRQCTLNGDLHDVILQFCTNLKKLYIQDDYEGVIKSETNEWLLQVHSSLEVFQLTPRISSRIANLNQFLEMNPSIRTFSTTSHCLGNHATEFLESKAKLDTLEILDGYYGPPMNIQTLCTQLNQLFERGFYKKLHLSIVGSNREAGDQFASLKALESISIDRFSESCGLSRLINLKSLTISDGVNAPDMEVLANSLVNLRSVSVGTVALDDILPLFRWSKMLRRVELHIDGNFLNLEILNREREKLNGAHKIMVYVADCVFLETKWTTQNGDTNLEWVEMRRSASQ